MSLLKQNTTRKKQVDKSITCLEFKLITWRSTSFNAFVIRRSRSENQKVIIHKTFTILYYGKAALKMRISESLHLQYNNYKK